MTPEEHVKRAEELLEAAEGSYTSDVKISLAARASAHLAAAQTINHAATMRVVSDSLAADQARATRQEAATRAYVISGTDAR